MFKIPRLDQLVGGPKYHSTRTFAGMLTFAVKRTVSWPSQITNTKFDTAKNM